MWSYQFIENDRHRHHLGGRLPNYVEIRCPTLDTRIKIDIPGSDGVDIKRAYAIFDRANLLNLCERRLRDTRDYHEAIERELSEGATLEFAWCFDAYLDWVWQLEDVQGRSRQWAVLYGLSMKQVNQACGAYNNFNCRDFLSTGLKTLAS